ncbi:hypothetical protein BDFB_012229 [Asbolus verrucosus]|uniref:Uncharacterized protein n=1 Tax=Asbolus verrucosus TaxID=1661398 RepID=A0A482VSI5_ASBVE|nr:hypothetical protein BDFB_012229 [Asbolus verrucosus]
MRFNNRFRRKVSSSFSGRFSQFGCNSRSKMFS